MPSKFTVEMATRDITDMVKFFRTRESLFFLHIYIAADWAGLLDDIEPNLDLVESTALGRSLANSSGVKLFRVEWGLRRL